MSTKVAGKHKKRYGYAGGPNRGPDRWARAAHSALTAPNSPAGKLYINRVVLADRVRTEYSDGKGSYAFHEWLRTYPLRELEVSYKRKYYTCSVFCTAMQIQLDFNGEWLGVDPLTNKHIYRKGFTYQELCEFMQTDERVSLPDCRPSRVARCQCCGSDIKP